MDAKHRLVVIESPLKGDMAMNKKYARACMRDCLMRGEYPFASHLLYAQEGILDDTIPTERKLGMEAGFAWEEFADATVVYVDLGISAGMEKGLQKAKEAGRPAEFRQLKNW